MSENSEKIALLKKERYDFHDLTAIMRLLRAEDGCPWDREQDHHSIRSCLIEETYEVAEAIDTENPTLLQEELGDLLFQVMFHAQIEAEADRFCVDDVVDDICKKMIHRHPHVFGTVEVANSGEVLKNWENIKTEEKQRNTLVQKLRAIPPMMPALMRASKVGKKAGEYADTTADMLLDLLGAQIQDIRTSLDSSDADRRAMIGSLLMNVTALSRKLDVDAEHALLQATDQLIERVAEREDTTL